MDVLRCVVLIVLFRKIAAKDFIISVNATTWPTANSQCKLAVPALTFTKDNIKVNIPLNMNDNEEVWVGYYQARTAFEYFGCAVKPHKPAYTTNKEDPGLCMSACGGNKHIGVYKNECFCFEKDELSSEHTTFPFCSEVCQDIMGIVCGGEDGSGKDKTKYISLYRSIGMDGFGIPHTDDNNEQINCMHYVKQTFHWDDCAQSYQPICGKGNTSWIQTDVGYGSWSELTIKCFNNNTRPSTYNNTKSLPTTVATPQIWTGIVRSWVIYKHTYEPNNMNHAILYGYLKKTKHSVVLEFAHDYDVKKRLCLNDSTTTPSSTEKTESTVTRQSIATSPLPNTSSTTMDISPPDIISPSSTIHTTHTTIPNNDTSSTDQLKDQSGTSDVGAIVGATLAIVLVIVIVVGVVLFLKKRGIKLPFTKKEKQAPVNNNVKTNNSYVISRPVEILHNTYKSDQDTYAEIDLTTTMDNEARDGEPNGAEESDYAHDYFILEKIEEKPYDSTKVEDQKSDPNTFNLYNKLSFEDPSYDHIGSSAGKAGRKVSDSENTYNTTTLGNSQLKTSVGVPSNAYNVTEDPDEDTYNHTNIPRHQMGLRVSENDYDAI